MTSSRDEMKQLSREARRDLARNFHNANKSMGRVGLSYARRHPALLLGGGALLGAAAVAWVNRSKHSAEVEPRPAETSSESEKQAPRSTWSVLLKSALRMWLVDHLAGMLAEKDGAAGADGAVAAREETVGSI